MFTTPCFIRKNTPELREYLEDLGYLYIPNGCGMWNVKADDCACIMTITHEFEGKTYWYYCPNMANWYHVLDCGENENLFKTIAALRDDSDIHQMFIKNDDNEWFKSEFYRIENYAHKATVEELIEHFNKHIMETKIQIKSISGRVLFEFEKENNTVQDTLEEAIKNNAELYYADLSGADLSEADLRWANMRWANMRGADLKECIGAIAYIESLKLSDDDAKN